MRFYNSMPITVTGAGYNIDLDGLVEEYYLIGTYGLISDWTFAYTGIPAEGMRCRIFYNATVTLGAFHMYFFGVPMPDVLCNKEFFIEVTYLNTAWVVTFHVDIQDQGIISTDDLVDNCVTNDKLANMVRGTVKVGDAAGEPSDLNAKTAGHVLIGDGTDIKSLAITGDIGMAVTGLVTIANDAVTNIKLAPLARGYIKVGNATNDVSDLNAKTSGYVLIGDGTDLNSVQVTGDITTTSGGVVTIVNDAVDNNKLANIARGSIKVGGVANAPTDLDAKTSGYILIGDGADLKSVQMTGDASITAAGVITVTANTPWEDGTGANSAQTEGAGCDASGDCSVALGFNTTASARGSFSTGNETTSKGVYSYAGGQESVAHLPVSEAFSSGRFNIDGDCQKIDTILKVATTNAVADNMQLNDGSDGITLPTDSTSNIYIRVVACQTGGASGTVSDSFIQNIKLCAKNKAGVSSVVTMNAATLANYSIVAGNVLYELSACDAAFGGTVAVTVAANKLQITVTGENNKNVSWMAYVSLVWVGYSNFII